MRRGRRSRPSRTEPEALQRRCAYNPVIRRCFSFTSILSSFILIIFLIFLSFSITEFYFNLSYFYSFLHSLNSFFFCFNYLPLHFTNFEYSFLQLIFILHTFLSILFISINPIYFWNHCILLLSKFYSLFCNNYFFFFIVSILFSISGRNFFPFFLQYILSSSS